METINEGNMQTNREFISSFPLAHENLESVLAKGFYRLLLCFPGCAGFESIVSASGYLDCSVFTVCSAHYDCDCLRHQCDDALKFNIKINLLTKVEQTG